MKRAVFLDRDGTINIEKEYLHKVKDFEFIPGAPEAVRLLNQAGIMVVVVTNQSGVARGYYTEVDVENLHRHVVSELESSGAHVDAWLYAGIAGEALVDQLLHFIDRRGERQVDLLCRTLQP